MIQLKFQDDKNLGISEIQVLNISAAWNQIRFWSCEFSKNLDDAILLVNEDNEPINSARIPSKIIFKINKKGKIEFRNYSKNTSSENIKAKENRLNPVIEKKTANSFSCVTKRGLVEIENIFNPIF